jgi:hypothetical protein
MVVRTSTGGGIQEGEGGVDKTHHASLNGWPARHAIKGIMKKYWGEKDKLSVADGLLLYSTRLVVPESLQYEILMKIHPGHQGIQRCRLRVSSSSCMMARGVQAGGKLCHGISYVHEEHTTPSRTNVAVISTKPPMGESWC